MEGEKNVQVSVNPLDNLITLQADSSKVSSVGVNMKSLSLSNNIDYSSDYYGAETIYSIVSNIADDLIDDYKSGIESTLLTYIRNNPIIIEDDDCDDSDELFNKNHIVSIELSHRNDVSKQFVIDYLVNK